jgi:hypothetical protein
MEQNLQNQIDDLQRQLDALKGAGTIPYDFEQALRTRFRLDRVDTLASIENSSKLASSENQQVNEAGSGLYNVLKSPDAFLQVEVAGAIKYIPIFT